MKFNPKLTGGLAWAGLIVILAVPGADMLTKPQADSANLITSDMDAVRTAAVAPQPADASKRPVTAVAASGDAVDQYISTGKKLPSYISDAPAEVASTKPAPITKLVVPTTPASGTTAPAIDVASTGSTGVNPLSSAPTPYPASLRPKVPVIVTTPTTPATTTTTVATTSTEEAPLILDEELVARREAAVSAVLEDDVAPPVRQTPRVISGDELEEWDSGSLADYLERRGMLSEGEAQASNSEFDEDGFFLNEGPNDSDGRRVVRRLPRRDNNDFFFF
jgi:hypothetical protein